MINHSLFNLQSIESDLQSAIESSMFRFNNTSGDATIWAQSELKQNIEQSMRGYSHRFITSGQDRCCGYGTPPSNGFKVTFGLQILVGYKLRFKASLNVGYGQRFGNVGATSSLHISAYNSGLGVGVNKDNIVVDVTAAANIIVGGGHGTPLQSYSLNYNSPIPMLNDFKNSFSYGQLFTWNSALHDNQFSLDRLQREGMIGFRIGNVNVSSNNDTKRAYFGGGTDMGWTGGLTIVTPLVEVGFQDFSGDYFRGIKDGSGDFNDDEKKDKLIEMGKNPFKSGFHRQIDYQKRLNKASTYIRFNHQNGYNVTIDVIGDAWLQNGIHKAIKDFKFDYEHNNIQGWGGVGF